MHSRNMQRVILILLLLTCLLGMHLIFLFKKTEEQSHNKQIFENSITNASNRQIFHLHLPNKKQKIPKMSQERVKERLNVMKSQEDSLYCCSDYFKEQQPRGTDGGGTIDYVCRLKMTQWCYTVIDYIKFRRETVSIAMSYLDRFLCSG